MKALGILALLGALALVAVAVLDEMYRSTRGWPARVLWEGD
jgi:hypothetical protein